MAVGIELQLEQTAAAVPHAAQFIGDVKLADFKESLASAGFKVNLLFVHTFNTCY
jgi:hypothetical protein